MTSVKHTHSYLTSINYYLNHNDTLHLLYNEGKINDDDVNEFMKRDIDKLRSKVQQIHPYKWGLSCGRWQTYVRDETKKDNRRRIKANSEIELLDCLIDFYADESLLVSKKTTLDTLYPKWLEYKRLHTTAETYIKRIMSDWNTYYKNTDIVKIPICELTRLQLDTWVHELIKKYSMSKNNYYNVTCIIRQMFEYAVMAGIIETNTFSQVTVDGKRLFRKVPKKESHTQVFSRKEECSLKEYAWNDFYNEVKDYVLSPLAVLFMFETGIRISEVCALKYEDIIDSSHIEIQRMLRRDTNEIVEHTKGTYGDRTTILTTEANKIIAAAKKYQNEHNIASEGYIFSNTGIPTAGLYRAVASLYTKYSHKQNIPTKSSHKARKTYISALIDAGVNIDSIREMVGHADERTTYNNYCFDRATDSERVKLVEKALK